MNMPTEQPDEQVRELAINLPHNLTKQGKHHAEDIARFILAREKKLREALEKMKTELETIQYQCQQALSVTDKEDGK